MKATKLLIGAIALIKAGLGADDLTPAQRNECLRVQRRLKKFPKLKGCPNPVAHRNAHFKARFGLDGFAEMP